MADRLIAAAWSRHLALLSATYVLLGGVFFDTFSNMVGVWTHSSTFNHCFLIPFIAAYMASTKRRQLQSILPGVSVYGLIYMLSNSGVWLTGQLMSVAFIMHLGVVGMLIGAAWTLLGNRAFKTVAFPFFYLYFAVPEGEFLVPYLQDWTAVVLVQLLHLTGMPVFIEGRYLTIPSGNFVVAEACSGVNYLIATLSVGTMFMYLRFRSIWRRLVFLLASVLVPLFANGMRAYGIVMISHLSNYKYAQGIDHFIYGGVFFALVIFALFSLGSLFSDVDGEDDVVPLQERGTAVATSRLAVMTALALCAAVLPRVTLHALDQARPMAGEVHLPTIPGWQGPEWVDSELKPQFPGADQYLAARYRSAQGDTVNVDVVYFSKQGIDGELVNQNNHVFSKKAWRQMDYGQRQLPSGAVVHDVDVLRLRSLKSEGSEMLVWSWYDSHGKRSARRLTIKLAEGLARLTGRNEGGAFIGIGMAVEGKGDAEAHRLQAFVDTGALTVERMHESP